MISIFLPRTVPPKSSAAICAATTEPIPLKSEYRPDMSARTPIFTTSFESCACAYVPWRQSVVATIVAKCAARRIVLAALSNRERDALGGLVPGRANKQIAYDLGISPRTVEVYRANLMNKMVCE